MNRGSIRAEAEHSIGQCVATGIRMCAYIVIRAATSVHTLGNLAVHIAGV